MPKRLSVCARCGSEQIIKSGVVNQRQRYKCKSCGYHFSVGKIGKKIDDYFVLKALQLYLEGVSYREIERLLGVSHVSVMNWVKQYKITRPERTDYHPSYRILKRTELIELMKDESYTSGKGLLITEVGDKFMVIHWDRFRDR